MLLVFLKLDFFLEMRGIGSYICEISGDVWGEEVGF